MPLQNFIDNSLPTVKAVWLNAIDAFYFTLFNSATTAAQARTALGSTATGDALFTTASATAARTTLDVPSNAEAILDTIMDAKGDLLVGTAADTVARKAIGADGTALTADSSQSDGLIWLPQVPHTLAPNPFFQVNQLQGTGTFADDTYFHDNWYVLNQTNPITPSHQTLQENGQATNVRLTQSNAAAQRFGYATILEAADSQPLRGRQLTFRPRVRISNSQAVRIAVLEWTGTADTVTSDVVNDWTSGAYTAGNFFLAANLTVTGVGAKTPGAATWTDMDALTVTIGSSANNLILFVWVEQTAAQNVTLDIGKVRFVPGAYAGDIYIPRFEETLRYAQRQFNKTFNYATTPAQAAGASGQIQSDYAYANNAGVTAVWHYPGGRMRTTPAITTYNPTQANANWRRNDDGADTNRTINTITEWCSNLQGDTSTSVGSNYVIQASAVARL